MPSSPHVPRIDHERRVLSIARSFHKCSLPDKRPVRARIKQLSHLLEQLNGDFGALATPRP